MRGDPRIISMGSFHALRALGSLFRKFGIQDRTGMPRWHLYSFVSHPFFILLFLPASLGLRLPPRKDLSHSRSPRSPLGTLYGIIISDHVELNYLYNAFYEIKSCRRLNRQRFKNYTVFFFTCFYLNSFVSGFGIADFFIFSKNSSDAL